MKRDELLAPEQYNMIQEVEQFTSDPNKLAIIWENEAGEIKEMTYQRLIKNANRIGNAFKNCGLKKGDAILIMVPRLIEAYAVYIAALKNGLVVSPSSELLRKNDIEYRLEHGDMKAVVSYFPYREQFDGVKGYDQLTKFIVGGEAEGWHSLSALMSEQSDELEFTTTNKNDLAFLSYTSGTTGNPKGVVHTHGWAYTHLRLAAKQWLSIEENDRVWATAGPGWQKWIWSPFLATLGLGATGFAYHGKFEPNRYLEKLEKYKINVLCCTPTEYRLMAKVDNLDQYDLSYLHSAVSAGEPLNREVIDIFLNHFDVTVRDGYGQTENSLIVGVKKEMKIRPGSMGKPMLPGLIEIIDEEGKIADAGEVGDIAIHKDMPSLFKEYYKEPERTKAQFRGDFYVTGDKAKKDEDGYFWFEGRSDDIIISSGYTIGPFEVEDALVKHPSVKECAVVASPDEVRGNIVKAYVILKDNVKQKNEELVTELQEHVKRITAPYKYPRKIKFVEELPKTISGKIRRIELRQKEPSN
ncbi:acyl-CoA synthetase MbcS [Pseudogracilibacillus sp. SO30301A]|uniref:acyl-CoA synthetase MbcS n=1 Tax=Pseudogracilibacillus sp. SO30301A TaxID=3098291 RepID=UPI00300DC795